MLKRLIIWGDKTKEKEGGYTTVLHSQTMLECGPAAQRTATKQRTEQITENHPQTVPRQPRKRHESVSEGRQDFRKEEECRGSCCKLGVPRNESVWGPVFV